MSSSRMSVRSPNGGAFGSIAPPHASPILNRLASTDAGSGAGEEGRSGDGVGTG